MVESVRYERRGAAVVLTIDRPERRNAVDGPTAEALTAAYERRHLDRALEMAEGLASFPQETMLADRRAAIEGFGLPLEAGLAIEARAGMETFEVALRGARRFAGGEGRRGTGAGV